MFRLRLFFSLILPVIIVALTMFSNQSLGQNRSIEKVAYAPPAFSLTASRTVITACAGDIGPATVVQLDAAGLSTGNPIRFTWKASGGRIEGTGQTVTWDLAGLEPGYYKANVAIATGTNDGECEYFASTSVLVRCTPLPPPICPNVSLSCPEEVAIDQPITFTANLVGGSGDVNTTFNWTVSAGTIIAGQGTPSITVDTKGLAGQTVKADFSMTGFPTDCAASCVVQIPLPRTVCAKFDEFPDLPRNDEKARLDNFAVQLQSDPRATGYVVMHPGSKGRSKDVQKHSSRIVDYLVNTRGLDGKRIVVVTGSAREELTIELVACPQGASPQLR